MTTLHPHDEELVAGADIAGAEALADALRHAVERGQAAADARQMRRLATLIRDGSGSTSVGFALPPITTVRRYRVAEVTVGFDALVRRDATVAGGFSFLRPAPARRSAPRRLLDAFRGRRLAPVTITISLGGAAGAHRDATGTGIER